MTDQISIFLSIGMLKENVWWSFQFIKIIQFFRIKSMLFLISLVACRFQNGEIISLKVVPEARAKDMIVLKMKHFKYLLFSYLLGSFCNLSAQGDYPYQFVSPKPGSLMVSNETNIILRYSGFIDRTSLSTSQIIVEGSESGEHAGEFILSDDGRTIVFNPHLAFTGKEEVYVVLSEGIRTRAGDASFNK